MQTPDGDYVFGQGGRNFLVDSSAAVAQLILTGLRLWRGEWFLDKNAGVPWTTAVIGKNTKQFYDLVIQNQIAFTIGVQSIERYNSVLDADQRSLSVSAKVNTVFGPASVAVII
jgi:hypothetical protein